MSFVVGIILLTVVTALACALPGVFIVLRKNSMLVDAISHAVLPGIVVGYFFTRSFDSPLLITGAALAGLLVVIGNEWLSRTGLVTGDAPQGLIFPALFSIGVILVSMNFGNVHLDTHAVLVGDLNLAAWNQLVIGSISLGPSYLYVMLGVLLINVLFLWATFPKLTLATFDRAYAQSLGIRAGLLHTSFMFLVSVTVTAAFNAVGAILVVALVIVPAATASLFSSRVPTMLTLTALIAVAGALLGFSTAYVLNAPTSAAMSVIYGALFAAALITSKLLQRRRQRVATHGLS